MLTALLDFLAPPRCAICRNSPSLSGNLCDECGESLSLMEAAAACTLCAMPLSTPGAPCPYCQGKGNPPLDAIARLGIYDEPLRKMILGIKYHYRWSLAEMLADRMLAHPATRTLIDQADVIIPVPLHPWRQFSRGYNQAGILAKRIGRQARVPVSGTLVRLKHTETQTRFHFAHHRHENLKDAFGLLKPSAVRGERVLLIDDVMTTASTLHAAARTLKSAEPVQINAVVIAIADPRRRNFETI